MRLSILALLATLTTGCQCFECTEHAADLVDSVGDNAVYVDGLYCAELDLTRIGYRDWCRSPVNRFLCGPGCPCSGCSEAACVLDEFHGTPPAVHIRPVGYCGDCSVQQHPGVAPPAPAPAAEPAELPELLPMPADPSVMLPAPAPSAEPAESGLGEPARFEVPQRPVPAAEAAAVRLPREQFVQPVAASVERPSTDADAIPRLPLSVPDAGLLKPGTRRQDRLHGNSRLFDDQP